MSIMEQKMQEQIEGALHKEEIEMRKTAIEKLSREIGHDIGLSDDVVQSDLINGMCSALWLSMSENDLNTQICSIVGRLERNSENIIIEMNEFIKLKRLNKEHEKASKGNS